MRRERKASVRPNSGEENTDAERVNGAQKPPTSCVPNSHSKIAAESFRKRVLPALVRGKHELGITDDSWEANAVSQVGSLVETGGYHRNTLGALRHLRAPQRKGYSKAGKRFAHRQRPGRCTMSVEAHRGSAPSTSCGGEDAEGITPCSTEEEARVQQEAQ